MQSPTYVMDDEDWAVFEGFLRRTYAELRGGEPVSLLKELFADDLKRWRATALFHLGLPIMAILNLIDAEPWRVGLALTDPNKAVEGLFLTELVEYTRSYNYVLYGSETEGIDL